jgi:outer membrane protein OmpA-like peptidoglycan-associated protein
LAASKTDYTGASLSFDKPTDADADTLYNVALCLAPVEKVVVPDTPIVATEPKDEQVALFDFAKYSLTKETGSVLDTLAAILKREKSLGLEILGYTDAVGSTEYNLKLSQQRADACRDYLVKHGVSASKLKSTGKGECCPLKPDTIDGRDNPEGRKANRRVEFKIYFTKG